MISKGNTHKNGVRLANYMITGKEGERAELWQLRGFEATNIVDAFRDVQIMAGATKCEHPFFHVQIRNRDAETLTRHQWEHAADRIERMLGLTDHPRAIAFHVDEKNGHEHMHIAWSRIDQETLKARPLPFFKERLKKISRDLEFDFGLEAVTNRRPDKIKYAPTRAEDEQARRLGLDPHQLRNTIRACYEHSDCGASFQAALAHEGFILARGEKRDFIVIDREGGMHALGKRILDDSATKIRARLSDLSRDNLPSVEQARILVLEKGLQEEKKRAGREKPEPAWDRDRDDRRWQDAVVNAAIEQEKAERKFVEPAPRQGRAGSRKEKEIWPNSPPAQKAVRTSPRYHFEDAARESTRQETATKPRRGPLAEIHAAWTRADNARAFVSALEERNFTAAVVTEQDITNSAIDRFYSSGYARLLPRELKQGDFVVIAENGRIYNLDRRTTGETADRAQAFMSSLDRKEFKGVYETVKGIEQKAQLRDIERQEFRDLSAGRPKRETETRPAPRIGKDMKSGVRRSVAGAEKAATRVIGGGKTAAGVIGKTLDVAADAFASLFAPTQTPRQQHENNLAARKREIEAEDAIDFTRYTSELAQQRRQEEERELSRERERGRER